MAFTRMSSKMAMLNKFGHNRPQAGWTNYCVICLCQRRYIYHPQTTKGIIMKNLISGILLLISINTYADQVWHESSIKIIYPQPTGGFVLTFETPAIGCTRLDQYHFVSPGKNGVTQDGANNMLKVVLAAAESNKIVRVLYDNSSSSCHINRLLVNY